MGSLADLAGKRVYLDANVFVTNDQPLRSALGVNCFLLSELTVD